MADVGNDDGRILITLQDRGLASERDAVETIAHEINHIRGILKTGILSEESAAENAAEKAREFFREAP